MAVQATLPGGSMRNREEQMSRELPMGRNATQVSDATFREKVALKNTDGISTERARL